MQRMFTTTFAKSVLEWLDDSITVQNDNTLEILL